MRIFGKVLRAVSTQGKAHWRGIVGLLRGRATRSSTASMCNAYGNPCATAVTRVHHLLLSGTPLRVFLVLAVLGGCATRPPTVPLESIDDHWTLRQESLQQLTRWQFSGRVSVVVPDQGWHAALDWIQQDNQYEIELAGPMGQGRLVIDGGPDGVRARGTDGTVVVASSAEALIVERMGWGLPVAGLRYWVRGIPDPASPVESMSLDSLGRLESLQQNGWRIRYPGYAEGVGIDLPRKLRLEREQVEVRLVIDEWSAGSDASQVRLDRGPGQHPRL